MRQSSAEHFLPSEILERASVRGGEYAWGVDDIPSVIQAARDANLLNIGGQLQFRLPDGETCECYWVEVDTSKSVPQKLPWQERVRLSYETALADYQRLRSSTNFLNEGKHAFPLLYEELDAEGRHPSEFICFVWYVQKEPNKLSEIWTNIQNSWPIKFLFAAKD
ncbi:hypothetical protein [Ferrovibrio sp.]|uniref:hypothetical protein n=1 Tax=Ferrovibrio sp. TaxID=1917215 RepID=UPI0035146174